MRYKQEENKQITKFSVEIFPNCLKIFTIEISKNSIGWITIPCITNLQNERISFEENYLKEKKCISFKLIENYMYQHEFKMFNDNLYFSFSVVEENDLGYKCQILITKHKESHLYKNT